MSDMAVEVACVSYALVIMAVFDLRFVSLIPTGLLCVHCFVGGLVTSLLVDELMGFHPASPNLGIAVAFATTVLCAVGWLLCARKQRP